MFVRIGKKEVDSDVYLDIIQLYNNNSDFMSFKDFVKSKGYIVPSDVEVCGKFILEYGSREMYDEFMFKNFPLGKANEIPSDEQLKIRNKVSDLAKRIIYGKANLIDIIEQVTPDINEFSYYLKHVRYTYKEISEGVLVQCRSYLDSVKNYRKCTVMTIEYSSLSREDRLTLISMLKDRKLPLNNITYAAIYEYAMNHRLLKELGDKMNYTSQEKIALYTRIIRNYVADPKAHDLVEYLEMNDYPISKQLNKVIKYAQKYINEELYEKFINKVYPFGLKDEKCSKEQQRLREKVKLISSEVAYQNANIIDIIENITPDLELYLYYLKQSRHYYEDVSSSVYHKVRDYILKNKNYTETGDVHVTYKDINDEDNRIIRELLNDKKIPVNTITYSAMREYAIVRGMISHGKIQKNSRR